MATSGWQEEKQLYNRGGAGNYVYYGRVRIDSISRSGTTVTVTGAIRFTAKGKSGYSSNYNYGVSAKHNGSGASWQTVLSNNESISNGSSKDISFTATYKNVAASTTSLSLSVEYAAWYNSSHSSTYWDVTKSWTLSFDPGGTAPTGGAITYNSCTWNSANITSSVTSWGGLTGNFQAIVVTGSYNGDAANATPTSWTVGRKVYKKNEVSSSTTSYTVNATDSNVDSAYNNPISIKGLLHYKLAYWNYNSAGRIDGLDDTLRYLPPAPSQFSYGTPTGSTDLTFPVTFAGVAANNHTTYDSANLNRTIRYKIGNGNWTYVDNGTVAAIDFATNFDVTVPAGQVATIEGWQTYHGMDSAVETITIANTNAPVALYGSVGGETKKLGPVYASVNGRTKKLIKIYASVGGVTKKVYEDV